MNKWEPFETFVKRLYFDTTLHSGDAMELLVKTVGVDNIVFASEMLGGVTTIDPQTAATSTTTSRASTASPGSPTRTAGKSSKTTPRRPIHVSARCSRSGAALRVDSGKVHGLQSLHTATATFWRD